MDEDLRLKREDVRRRTAIESKASSPHFKPGSVQAKRYVDPLDYDRWEQQRLERKAKNHTLDPYL